MAFIDIITNNQTRQNRNTVTYEDNWVYVPGNTITGDGSKPYLITTLSDFKKLFGNYSPNGSMTFEYVSGILNAGLPIIFRRIVSADPDSTTAASLVTKATATVTKTITVDNDEETVPVITFQERYGGSFGNGLFISFRKGKSGYYLDVKYDSNTTDIKYASAATIESYRIMDIVAEETEAEFNTRLLAALKAIKTNDTLERIVITQLDETLAYYDVIDKYIPGTAEYVTGSYIKLSGGADISEANLTQLYSGIALSYASIKDKLLYNPKYLTTGGFCQTEDTTTHSAMIDKMLELSQLRQDCLALVDLQIGLSNGEQYQTLMTKYGYTQSSATQILPAAVACGPWYYTLVGTDYMWMPGSFAYLSVVGANLSVGGKTYTPKAGIQNGKLNYVTRTEFDIGSDLIEEWQAAEVVNINPIVRMQGGNYMIAGNSTLLIKDEDEENLYSEASATMAIIEIKRLAYNTATEYQYMYNSVEAFENFSLEIANKLNAMQSEGAIYKYDIINNSSNDEPRKLKILLNVWLTPSIRNIEIYLNVAYGDITVSSEGGKK